MTNYAVVYSFPSGKEVERTLLGENLEEIKSIIFNDVVVEFDEGDTYYRFNLDDCLVVSIKEAN